MKATKQPLEKKREEFKFTPFSLCDGKTKQSTIKLASFLAQLSKSGKILYGHQNDRHSKAGPVQPGFTGSDTEDVCGRAAAIMGIDALSLTGMELGECSWERQKRLNAAISLCEKASKEGSIISLSAHMPNFELVQQNLKGGAADYSGYTPNDLRGNVVQDIMPGKRLNGIFTGYLDLVCDLLLALAEKDIPVIWRPFHENTGGWFWWGCDTCSPEEFKNLWKYTWEYMTDVKNVHNVIWAYSPGSEPSSISEFEERYPGDSYIDLIGLDMYQNYSFDYAAFWQDYDRQLELSALAAKKHGKLFANTETGIMRPENKALLDEGNERGWYERVAGICLKHKACYFLLWANFGADKAYYTPYVTRRKTDSRGIPVELEGHELLDDFISFHNMDNVIFAGQIPAFS
ncbi:MAG: glycoside hydrolase family 26 protein [Treponema sp.]|nr:glycoside hydrolase family 26 protein [Treponema sp.]